MQTVDLSRRSAPSLVDGLGLPTWLFDAAGRCAHESPEAARLLSKLTEGDVLRAAVGQFARSLLLSRRTGVPATPSWSLAIDGRRLTLLGAFVEDNAAPSVVVRVEVAGTPMPEKLTFHIARHTWADLARKSGRDVYEISRGLAHSGLGVTERYLARGGGDVVNGEI